VFVSLACTTQIKLPPFRSWVWHLEITWVGSVELLFLFGERNSDNEVKVAGINKNETQLTCSGSWVKMGKGRDKRVTLCLLIYPVPKEEKEGY
jgi:hypothetical protein